VISPLSRAQPHFEARDLHPTQWGRLCPSETPEGPNCGLVKNFAEMVELSTGVDDIEPVKQVLYNLGVEKFQFILPEIIEVQYDSAEKEEFESEFEEKAIGIKKTEGEFHEDGEAMPEIEEEHKSTGRDDDTEDDFLGGMDYDGGIEE